MLADLGNNATGGKFVGVATIDAAHGIVTGITKGLGDLGRCLPGLAVMRKNGEMGVMEGKALTSDVRTFHVK
ncbi:hypothetical protein ACET97_21455 [Aeromonas enteropelogenes]|uniref:hypothetical protein n=1 Tax=Aeromonas enteropelogenes TaxID=29489 RepID=UPI0038D09628